MKKDIGLLVELVEGTYQVTIPELGGLVVSGASADEAMLRAVMAIDQAHMHNLRAKLAHKASKKAKQNKTVA